MAQHDYVLDNAPGAGFRADLNLALQALISQNAAPVEPLTTFPFMIWLDTSTTPNTFRMRNAANSAWITPPSANLPLAGGRMTGHILLPYGLNPTDVDHAARKAYVDALVAAREPALAAANAAYYYRGDKTWQVLNSTAVGLGNVNNTSDAAKPVSTAQAQYAVYKGGDTMTGNLYIEGNGNFNSVSQLNIRSVSGDCYISYYRNNYAMNMGLRTDNLFWMGGWSNGANIYRWYSDTAGGFVAYGNVAAYSDVRDKEDIETIQDALGKVKRMRGVSYTRISTKQKQVGVVAQEMQEIVPEVVGEDPNGKLNVAYGNLMGVAIQAIKELTARVEVLEGQVRAFHQPTEEQQPRLVPGVSKTERILSEPRPPMTPPPTGVREGRIIIGPQPDPYEPPESEDKK